MRNRNFQRHALRISQTKGKRPIAVKTTHARHHAIKRNYIHKAAGIIASWGKSALIVKKKPLPDHFVPPTKWWKFGLGFIHDYLSDLMPLHVPHSN